MRRHAEGLIILSGAAPGRAWSSPVPVIDVIRGAVAEIEDYKRIAVATTSEDMVAGSAVADTIHLLAELIENAALFSPSGTRVEVKGERVGNGFAFEVEDRGLGIKPEELDAINLRLSSPADFDLANADQLGLFVVGKLAARHGVRVYLRPSPYGGTTAIVLLPSSMITSDVETAATARPEEGQATTPSFEDLQLALTGRPPRRTWPEADADPGQPDVLPTRKRALPGLPDTGSLPALPDSGSLPALLGTAPGLPGTAPGLPGTAASQPAATAHQPVLPRRSGGSPDAGTYRGLPRRVRQANLSPHLRGSPSSGASAGLHEPETRSPEQARSLLASLQSGWERGRQAETGESEATVGGPEAAGGAREAPQEEA